MKIITHKDYAFSTILTDEEFDGVRAAWSDGKIAHVKRLDRILFPNFGGWAGTPPGCEGQDLYVGSKSNQLWALERGNIEVVHMVLPWPDKEEKHYYWSLVYNNTVEDTFEGFGKDGMAEAISDGRLVPVDDKIRDNDFSFISHFPGDKVTR